MQNKISGLILLFILPNFLFGPVPIFQQEEQNENVEISEPLPGSAVQGLLQIIGTVNINDLEFYRLEFSSQSSQAQTWFLIRENDSNITNDIIGEWDTSILTDGNYTLRLTVYRQSDEPIIKLVEGIRIRNYTPIETNTPAPTEDAAIPTATIENTPTITPTSTVPPSPTLAPKNPAEVNQQAISDAIIMGGIIGATAAIFIYLYIRVRIKQ